MRGWSDAAIDDEEVADFIVLYLLSQNLRFTGIGLVMAAAGYGLEAVGALRERRAASAAV